MDVVKLFYKLYMKHTSAVSWMCEVSHDLNISVLELRVDSNTLVTQKVLLCVLQVLLDFLSHWFSLFLTYDLFKPSYWPHLYQHF